MAPSVSVNFISLDTSCVGLREEEEPQTARPISLDTSCVGFREEEPQTAQPMSFSWASHIAASVVMGS